MIKLNLLLITMLSRQSLPEQSRVLGLYVVWEFFEQGLQDFKKLKGVDVYRGMVVV